MTNSYGLTSADPGVDEPRRIQSREIRFSKGTTRDWTAGMYALNNDRKPDALMLTIEQTAEALHIGRTTVYALIRDGHLRAVHIGRSCRITLAELHRYVERLDSPRPAPKPRPPRPTPEHQGELFGGGIPQMSPDPS